MRWCPLNILYYTYMAEAEGPCHNLLISHYGWTTYRTHIHKITSRPPRTQTYLDKKLGLDRSARCNNSVCLIRWAVKEVGGVWLWKAMWECLTAVQERAPQISVRRRPQRSSDSVRNFSLCHLFQIRIICGVTTDTRRMGWRTKIISYLMTTFLTH